MKLTKETKITQLCKCYKLRSNNYIQLTKNAKKISENRIFEFFLLYFLGNTKEYNKTSVVFFCFECNLGREIKLHPKTFFMIIPIK